MLLVSQLRRAMGKAARREIDQESSSHKMKEEFHNRMQFILSKAGYRRSPDELRELARIISKIKFFQSKRIKSHELLEIVSSFQFERCSEFQNVFEYGDPGERLYIILKGVVSIRTPNPAVQDWARHHKNYLELLAWKKQVLEPKLDAAIQRRYEELEACEAPEKRASIELRNKEKENAEQTKSLIAAQLLRKPAAACPRIRVVRSYRVRRSTHGQVFDAACFKKGGVKFRFQVNQDAGLKRAELQKLKELKKYEGYEWFAEVVRNRAGDSFGELALQQREPEKRKRAATALCLSECDFAVLERKEYDKVVRRLEQKELNAKMEFFTGLPFLRHWTIHQIQKHRLHYFFKAESYKRNQVVLREGTPANWVYVVREGDFEMIRRVAVPVDKEEAHAKKVRGLIGPSGQDPRSGHRRIKRGGSHSLQRKAATKDVKISLMCSGQLFGHDDVMAGRRYSTTVQCVSSEGTLYCIKAADFFYKMGKDERTWSTLQEMCKQQDTKNKTKSRELAQPFDFDKIKVAKESLPPEQVLTVLQTQLKSREPSPKQCEPSTH